MGALLGHMVNPFGAAIGIGCQLIPGLGGRFTRVAISFGVWSVFAAMMSLIDTGLTGPEKMRAWILGGIATAVWSLIAAVLRRNKQNA